MGFQGNSVERNHSCHLYFLPWTVTIIMMHSILLYPRKKHRNTALGHLGPTLWAMGIHAGASRLGSRVPSTRCSRIMESTASSFTLPHHSAYASIIGLAKLCLVINYHSMPLTRQYASRGRGHVLFVPGSQAHGGKSGSYCCTGWSLAHWEQHFPLQVPKKHQCHPNFVHTVDLGLETFIPIYK